MRRISRILRFTVQYGELMAYKKVFFCPVCDRVPRVNWEKDRGL